MESLKACTCVCIYVQIMIVYFPVIALHIYALWPTGVGELSGFGPWAGSFWPEPVLWTCAFYLRTDWQTGQTKQMKSDLRLLFSFSWHITWLVLYFDCWLQSRLCIQAAVTNFSLDLNHYILTTCPGWPGKLLVLQVAVTDSSDSSLDMWKIIIQCIYILDLYKPIWGWPGRLLVLSLATCLVTGKASADYMIDLCNLQIHA